MNAYLLFLAIIYFLTLLFIYFVENRLANRDVFSPGNIFIYFSALSGLSLMWFSLSSDSLNELIFEHIDSQYHRMDLVYIAYLYTTIGILISYLGIFFGNNVKHPLLNEIFLKTFPLKSFQGNNTNHKNLSKVFNKGLVVLTIGIFVYLVFIQRMGGISDLWENLNERVDRSAGLGYLQIFYSYSIVFGSLLTIYACVSKRKFLFSALIVLITCFILASLGQRGPVAEFIFSVIVVYHYKVRKIHSVLNIRTISIAIFFIVFMLLSVQFRTIGALEKYKSEPIELLTDARNSFERHVIARFGRLERDVVILGYFEKNNIWWGASYYSLITAPLPRNYYPEKPPVDTGRYLAAIAEGQVITPPIPVGDLPTTSWPDANWAGYMNFYIPGFIAAYFLSGFILGFIFQHVRFRNFSIAIVAFYGMFSWGGIPVVSPMGLVNITTDLGMLLLWCYTFALLGLLSREK